MRKLARYRQPKFTANMNDGEFRDNEEFAARHAVRQLDLTEDSFPVAVNLYYEVKPGTTARNLGYRSDGARRWIHVISGRYQFASLKEVRP